MSTITIEVDEKNISFVKTLLEHLKGVKNVTINEGNSPYNPDFVNSIEEGRAPNINAVNVLQFLPRIYGSKTNQKSIRTFGVLEKIRQ